MIITKQVLNLKPHRNFSQEKKGDIFDKSQKKQQQKNLQPKNFKKVHTQIRPFLDSAIMVKVKKIYEDSLDSILSPLSQVKI